MADSAKPAGVEELMGLANEYASDYEKYIHATYGNQTMSCNELNSSRKALESALTELVKERNEARILLRGVVDHARRYHQCNDGPFDMADNFLAGKPYKEEPIL